MKPTFFLLGGWKCGSTSLHTYLSQHPEVYMSEPKEPFFFEALFERGFDFYQSFFPNWRGEPQVGEGTVQKLYLPYIPQRIQQHFPKAKLLAILRNPIDRAYSHWWDYRSHGWERLSFENALKQDLERIKSGVDFSGPDSEQLFHDEIYRMLHAPRRWKLARQRAKIRGYLDVGYYPKQLERYFRLFPRSQIEVILLDDLRKDPQGVMRRIWEFLRVDPEFQLPDSSHYNIGVDKRPRTGLAYILIQLVGKTRIYKLMSRKFKDGTNILLYRQEKRPPMKPKTRKWLLDHFQEHIHALEELLGRSLENWYSQV